MSVEKAGAFERGEGACLRACVQARICEGAGVWVEAEGDDRGACAYAAASGVGGVRGGRVRVRGQGARLSVAVRVCG